MKKILLSILACILVATGLQAQEPIAEAAVQDSAVTLSPKELRKLRVARRNLHYNILGGCSPRTALCNVR